MITNLLTQMIWLNYNKTKFIIVLLFHSTSSCTYLLSSRHGKTMTICETTRLNFHFAFLRVNFLIPHTFTTSFYLLNLLFLASSVLSVSLSAMKLLVDEINSHKSHLNAVREDVFVLKNMNLNIKRRVQN